MLLTWPMSIGGNAGLSVGKSFDLPLQTSIVPVGSAGSSTPTYTNATAGRYVLGYGPTAVIADGPILLAVAANEARFVGARRISEGVWSAVDANGVFLSTTNGASSLCTDASGPYGYLPENAATNLILQSNTLGTTWTISNAADMNAVAADAYVSVDGATTMDKLQPKATTAVHSLDQAFTFTAAKYTTAVDLRYVSATPQRWVAIICNDGTTTWGASFDLLNGVAGAVSAGATSTIAADELLADVYRCSVTNTANAAAAAGTVKISLNATDTATLESAARAGTETLGAGMVQHEIGLFATSRITTTTVAVTRAEDVLTFPSAGNVINATGTISLEVTPSTLASGTYVLWDPDATDTTPRFYYNSANILLRDGTNLVNVAHGFVVGTPAKVVGVWGGAVNGLEVFVNGVSVGTAASVLNFLTGATLFRIGGTNMGGEAVSSPVRLMKGWTRALSAAEVASL